MVCQSGAALLWLLAAAGAAVAGEAPKAPALAVAEDVIKGLCYHPDPLRTPVEHDELPQERAKLMPLQDDWMSESAKPLWGPRYRGDLRTIQTLGANAVRLIHVDPDSNHMRFLDEAFSMGLDVAVGIAEPDGSNCQESGFDCYEQFKHLYSKLFKSGFALDDNSYHPALKYVTIYQVPDHRDIGVSDEDEARAIISALDGMLDAERERGIQLVNFPNFTVTFRNMTFSSGQMVTLQTAMQHPDAFNGYEPKNDLAEAFESRWTHSFVGEGSLQDVQMHMLDGYALKFPTTPMFIAEFRKPVHEEFAQVGEILKLAENVTFFLGLFYVQYQVAQWDQGSKAQSPLFGLGEHIITAMPYFGKEYNVWCLTPLPMEDGDVNRNRSRPEELAKVYGGRYKKPDKEDLCEHNPAAVELNQNGYETIAKEANPTRVAEFLHRIVLHLGAVVVDEDGFMKFAESHMATENPSSRPSGEIPSESLLQDVAMPTLDAIVDAMMKKPEWASFDDSGARCIADRCADVSKVVMEMQRACETGGEMTKESCKNVPPSCQRDTFAVADYIFSAFYKETTPKVPLNVSTSAAATSGSSSVPDCYRGGVGIYANSAIWWHLYPDCVVDTLEKASGALDDYSELRGMITPHTCSDKMWSTRQTPTVKALPESARALTSTVTTQSPPGDPLSNVTIPAAVLKSDGASAAANSSKLRSRAVDKAKGNFTGQPSGTTTWEKAGWVWMLAIAAVLGVATAGALCKVLKPGYPKGSGRKAGKRSPDISNSSSEDGDNSDSSSGSEYESAPEAAPLARTGPGQQPARPAPVLPVDRRRRPAAHPQHSVAQGAMRVDAMAMSTAVIPQMYNA